MSNTLLRIAGDAAMQGARRNKAAAVGLQLTSGAQYVHGGAGAFNQALVRIIMRARIDAVGPNGNAVLAGTTTFGATGWGFLGNSYPGQPGAPRGTMKAYSNVYTPAVADPIHVPADGETQRLRTYEIWLDTAAGLMHLFCDGAEIGIGVATALGSLAIATNVGINTRANALGTLPWGAMTIVELQTSTTAPTRAQIRATAAAAVGTVVAGAQRLWVASDLGAAGSPAPATWTDRLAGTVLTIVGAPSLALAARTRPAVGTVEVFGDSIAAGRDPSGGLNEGWRRRALINVSTANRFIAMTGPNFFTTITTPLDFDARHAAVGGQGLGVPSSGASCLSTLPAAVTQYGAVDCVTLLAYGINDIVYRIITLGQTEAATVAAFLADLDAACAIIRGTRTAPIYIQNVLRISLIASGSTATTRSTIDTLNAALPAAVAALNTTYGNVYLIDACSAVTPTQAAADDLAVLYDGTHETTASKIVHGDTVSGVLLATAA